MSNPTPNPTLDANGLPLCNQDGCALFDGKRCSAIGFRPDRFCEPSLVEMVAENRRRVGDLSAVRDALLQHHESGARSSISESTRERGGRRLVQNRPGPVPSLPDLPPALPAETHKFLRDLYDLLNGCPLGHDGQGQVLTHRSTSTVDVVEWINRIHEAKRAISDIAPRCMSCGDTCLTPSAAPCPECRPFGDDQRAPCARDAPEQAQHGPDCPAWCPERAAVTIEAAPPEDLLDRITPEPTCRHLRRSLRPDAHGNPVTTCIDCGDEIP